jgi:1,4-dihydroxy-2-naphthoate octaprenyltransferase
MQAPSWSWTAVLSLAPVLLAQFALILVLDFPDAEGDACAGKRTLVVLLGRERAVELTVVAVLAVYGVLPVLVAAGVGGDLAYGVGATLPLAAWVVWTLLRGRWRSGGSAADLAWSGVLWFAAVSAESLLATAMNRIGRS